jgi:hypothetical protein
MFVSTAKLIRLLPFLPRYAKDMEGYVPPPESEQSSTPSRRKKAAKDPNAPKGAVGAYFTFCKDMREEAKTKVEHPNKVTEVGKMLGQMWREVDAATKKKYEDLAASDRERYRNEKAKYDSAGATSDPAEEEEEDEDESLSSDDSEDKSDNASRAR